MIKVLNERLRRISMGQDPKYLDQRFRRTTAQFYSMTWGEKTFQRQIKESRKIEDIILPFVTTATKALKKDEELADGQWKYELNTQISHFLEILSNCLLTAGGASQELAQRLEGYRVRLKADPPPPERDKEKVVADTESVRSARSREDMLKSVSTEGVGRLFGLTDDALQVKLRSLQNVCTEQAALEDLKVRRLSCGHADS